MQADTDNWEIGSNNYARLGTIENYSSAVVGYPAINSISRNKLKQWRCTDTAPTIEIDLGGGTPITRIYIEFEYDYGVSSLSCGGDSTPIGAGAGNPVTLTTVKLNKRIAYYTCSVSHRYFKFTFTPETANNLKVKRIVLFAYIDEFDGDFIESSSGRMPHNPIAGRVSSHRRAINKEITAIDGTNRLNRTGADKTSINLYFYGNIEVKERLNEFSNYATLFIIITDNYELYEGFIRDNTLGSNYLELSIDDIRVKLYKDEADKYPFASDYKYAPSTGKYNLGLALWIKEVYTAFGSTYILKIYHSHDGITYNIVGYSNSNVFIFDSAIRTAYLKFELYNYSTQITSYPANLEIYEDTYFDITERVIGFEIRKEIDESLRTYKLPYYKLEVDNSDNAFNRKNTSSEYYQYLNSGKAKITIEVMMNSGDWCQPQICERLVDYGKNEIVCAQEGSCKWQHWENDCIDGKPENIYPTNIDYWVSSVYGNDSNIGTFESPFKTLSGIYNHLKNNSLSNKTVFFLPGDYYCGDGFTHYLTVSNTTYIGCGTSSIIHMQGGSTSRYWAGIIYMAGLSIRNFLISIEHEGREQSPAGYLGFFILAGQTNSFYNNVFKELYSGVAIRTPIINFNAGSYTPDIDIKQNVFYGFDNRACYLANSGTLNTYPYPNDSELRDLNNIYYDCIIDFDNGIGADINIDWSCLYSCVLIGTSANCITSDPDFKDLVSYWLNTGSPCIGTGESGLDMGIWDGAYKNTAFCGYVASDNWILLGTFRIRKFSSNGKFLTGEGGSRLFQKIETSLLEVKTPLELAEDIMWNKDKQKVIYSLNPGANIKTDTQLWEYVGKGSIDDDYGMCAVNLTTETYFDICRTDKFIFLSTFIYGGTIGTIRKLLLDGQEIDSWAVGLSGFNKHTNLATDGEYLYVSERASSPIITILKYDFDGNLIAFNSIPSPFAGTCDGLGLVYNVVENKLYWIITNLLGPPINYWYEVNRTTLTWVYVTAKSYDNKYLLSIDYDPNIDRYLMLVQDTVPITKIMLAYGSGINQYDDYENITVRNSAVGIAMFKNGDIYASYMSATSNQYIARIVRRYFWLENSNIQYDGKVDYDEPVNFDKPLIYIDSELQEIPGEVRSFIDNQLQTPLYYLNLETGELQSLYIVPNNAIVRASYDYKYSIQYMSEIEEKNRWTLIGKLASTRNFIALIDQQEELKFDDKRFMEVFYVDDISSPLTIRLGMQYSKDIYGLKNIIYDAILGYNTIIAYTEDGNNLSLTTDYTLTPNGDYLDINFQTTVANTLVYVRYKIQKNIIILTEEDVSNPKYEWGTDNIFNKIKVKGKRNYPSDVPILISKHFALSPFKNSESSGLENIVEINQEGLYQWNGNERISEESAIEQAKFLYEFNQPMIQGTNSYKVIYGDESVDPDRMGTIPTPLIDPRPHFYKITPIPGLGGTNYEVIVSNTKEWRLCVETDFGDINAGNTTGGLPSSASDIKTTSHYYLKNMNDNHGDNTTHYIAYITKEKYYYIDENNQVVESNSIDEANTNQPLTTVTADKKIIVEVMPENDQGSPLFEVEPHVSWEDWTVIVIDKVEIKNSGVNVDFDNKMADTGFLDITIIGYPIVKSENIIAVASDLNSQDSYGVRDKIITNDFISNTDSAQMLATYILNLHKESPDTINLSSVFIPVLELEDIVELVLPSIYYENVLFEIIRLSVVWNSRNLKLNMKLLEIK